MGWEEKDGDGMGGEGWREEKDGDGMGRMHTGFIPTTTKLVPTALS